MSSVVIRQDPDVRMRAMHSAHLLPLTRFILGLTSGHRQTAEDVAQETMLRAWRHIDTVPLDDEASRRWLFTVARRIVIDDVRRKIVRPLAAAPLDAELVRTDDVTAGAAVAGQALREAVAQLSPAHREVLHQVYYQDREPAEVAARLGIPVGTVHSRIHYALRRLRFAVAG